jgi:hypothetical protein
VRLASASLLRTRSLAKFYLGLALTVRGPWAALLTSHPRGKTGYRVAPASAAVPLCGCQRTYLAACYPVAWAQPPEGDTVRETVRATQWGRHSERDIVGDTVGVAVRETQWGRHSGGDTVRET